MQYAAVLKYRSIFLLLGTDHVTVKTNERMKFMSILCSVVVPMYNEEAVVSETYSRLTEVMEKPATAMKLFSLMTEAGIIQLRC